MAGSKKKRKRAEQSIEASRQKLSDAVQNFTGDSAELSTSKLRDQVEKIRLAIDDAVNCYIRKRSMLTTPHQCLSAAESLSRTLLNLSKIDFVKINQTAENVRESIRIEGWDPDKLIISAIEAESTGESVKN